MDEEIITKEGTTVSLRSILLFSRNHEENFIFEMVERSNQERIFLVYKKEQNIQKTQKEICSFSFHFKKDLSNIFPIERLDKITYPNSQMSFYTQNSSVNKDLLSEVKNYADVL